MSAGGTQSSGSFGQSSYSRAPSLFQLLSQNYQRPQQPMGFGGQNPLLSPMQQMQSAQQMQYPMQSNPMQGMQMPSLPQQAQAVPMQGMPTQSAYQGQMPTQATPLGSISPVSGMGGNLGGNLPISGKGGGAPTTQAGPPQSVDVQKFAKGGIISLLAQHNSGER